MLSTSVHICIVKISDFFFLQVYNHFPVLCFIREIINEFWIQIRVHTIYEYTAHNMHITIVSILNQHNIMEKRLENINVGLRWTKFYLVWGFQQINNFKVHIFLLFTLYSKMINEIDRKYMPKEYAFIYLLIILIKTVYL